MKKIKQILYLCAFLILIAGCDKDFVEINTDPFQINDLDLGLVFAGAQRTTVGDWELSTPLFNSLIRLTMALPGFNFNETSTISNGSLINTMMHNQFRSC
jgi:hypothetical protein